MLDRCRDIEKRYPLCPSDWHKCHQYSVAPKVMREMKHAWTFGIGKEAKHEGWLRHLNPNVIVQSFDPTELSRSTIDRENATVMRRDKHMGLQGKPLQWFDWAYHPSGEPVEFYTHDPERKCYSTINIESEELFDQCTVQTRNIHSLLQTQLRPDYIKFDMEGIWYEFVCDVLDNKLWVNQLVGEFEMYYGDADQQFERLDTVIEAMQHKGYTVFTNRQLQTEMVELAFVKQELV